MSEKKLWIARNQDGWVYLFSSKPFRKTIFDEWESEDGHSVLWGDEGSFTHIIKWQDDTKEVDDELMKELI